MKLEPTEGRKSSVIHVVVLVGLLAIGTALRAAYLTARPVWYDEAITIFQAKSGFSYILSHYFQGSNPPVAYLVYRLWILIFGDSQISFEIVSVIFGIGSLYLMYQIACRVFDRITANIALVLLTFSSYHIFTCQQIRAYSLACFLALLSIDQLVCFLQKRHKKHLIAWGAVGITMVLTHFYTVFLFLVQILLLIQRYAHYKKIDRLKTWHIYTGGSAVIVWVTYLAIFLVKKFHFFPIYPRPHAAWADLQLVLQSIFFLSPALVVISCMIVTVFLVKYFWKEKHSDHAEKPFVVFLISWIFISIVVPLLISQTMPSFFYVRYYIFTHLAWILLTAIAVRSVGTFIFHVVVCGTFIFFLSGLVADYYDDCAQKAKIRKVYEEVAKEYRPGDVIVHENGWTFGPAFFYHQGKLDEYYLTNEFGIPTLEKQKFKPEILQSHKRLWLFLERPESLPKVLPQAWLQNSAKRMLKANPTQLWFLYELKE